MSYLYLIPIENILPSDFGFIDLFKREDSSSILENISYQRFRKYLSPSGVGFDALFIIEGELAISIPGLPCIELLISPGDNGFSEISAILEIGRTSRLILDKFRLGLRISSDILKPLPDENGSTPDYIIISTKGSISIDSNLDVNFKDFDSVSLSRCMIGDTGIIISVDELRFSDSAQGISFDSVKVELPPDLPAAPDLEFRNCTISAGGFSGEASATWQLTYNNTNKALEGKVVGSLFGINDLVVGLEKVALSFKDNIPTRIEIRGKAIIPYFDPKPINVAFSFGSNGELLISLTDLGLEFDKQGLFKLMVSGIEFLNTAEETAVSISGDLKVTATDAIPKISLQGLSVFKAGSDPWKLRLEGGTVDIKKSFDLYGFRVDLNEFGIGDNNILFSGGIQLLDGFDASGWVKGLSIPLEPDGKLSLEGVGLLVVSPGSFEFKGEILHEEKEGKSIFQGGISLNVIPLGMGFESQIMIGKNQKDPQFSYAFVYAKLNNPPPGWPLGFLPLFVRSIDGLIGVNVTLNANEIHEYFPLSERSPTGITHASKWRDEYESNAIGFGIGLATATDRLFNMSALLAFLFPDLKLIVEGKAFVLEKPSPGKKPSFHALMALQTDPFAALINISTQYEFIKGVIHAHGVMEVYYGPDPENNSNTTWYFTLGQITPYFPADKLISIKVLHIFEARGFLMVMKNLFGIGAEIRLSAKYDLVIVTVKFKALIGGGIVLRWDPEQIKGWIDLAGELGFRIFGIGFDIWLGASVLGMAPDWLIDALLRFGVSFNLIFKKVTIEAEIPFHWEKQIIPPIPDVLEEVKLLHAVEDRTWAPLLKSDGGLPAFEDIPAVEPDCQPVISFRFPIKDHTELPFGQNVQSILDHVSGDYTFTAELPRQGIKMWRCPIGEYEEALRENRAPDWKRFFNPLLAGDPKAGNGPFLYGAWLAVEDPDGVVGATYLQLFVRTPFGYDRNRVLSRGEAIRIFERVASLPSESISSGSAELAFNSPNPGRDGSPLALPVVPVDKPDTRIKYDESPRPYPLRSANFVKNEVPGYPFSGKDKTSEKWSSNFLRSNKGDYSSGMTLELGVAKLGSTLGFKIAKEDNNPYPLKYLEIGGGTKTPNHLLLSFKEPVKQVTIHYMDPESKKKLPPSDVEAVYKRQQPERGPWHFGKQFSVPTTSHISDDQIVISIDPAKVDKNSVKNFNFIKLRICECLKILSISCEIDKSEELALCNDQLEGFLDLTWRQPKVSSTLSESHKMNPSGEMAIGNRHGGPVTIGERSYVYDSSSEINAPESQIILPTPDGPIIPGYVYKIMISTEVSRVNGGGTHSRNDTRYAYFKVEDPPTTLKPYILRTFPRDTGYPQYRARELFVRFLKNYIYKLFPEDYGYLKWNLTNDSGLNVIFDSQNPLTSDYSLGNYVNDADEGIAGWRWGACPDHTLTKEERLWMDAYNRNAPPEKALSEEMILGDNMMWIYPVNPVLLRASFTSSPELNISELGDGTPIDLGESGPWLSDKSGRLYHDISETAQGESYLLTKDSYEAGYMLSVWLRPGMIQGEEAGKTGIIFLRAENTSLYSFYLKIAIDLEAKRLRLIKESIGGNPDNQVIFVDKEFRIASGRWTRLKLFVKAGQTESGNNAIFITFQKSDEIIFSITLEGEPLNDLQGNRKVGIFASSDYAGYYDNIEILSISRLERIPRAEENHQLTLKYQNKELCQLQFRASQYIDFFDHMNSWDRMVWTSTQDSIGINGIVDPVSGRTVADLVAAWEQIIDHSGSGLVDLMGQLLADEDDLILKMLTEADVQDTTEANVQNTKNALKEVRFELDQHFQTIAEALGFDLITPPQKFEFTLSKDRYALFVQCSEPIDWTRISADPIIQVRPEEKVFNTKIIHSSDMTRAIILIKEDDEYTIFSGEQYTWKVKLNSYIPNYLNWLKPWFEERDESYEFTLEIRSF